MAEQDQAQKTEDPTPKRREEARQRGQIPTSREIATAVLLVTAMLVLYMGMATAGAELKEAMRDFFEFRDWLTVDAAASQEALNRVANHLADILLPVLIPFTLAALIAYIPQTQLNVSFEPLKPKPNKISPVQGLQRIFSKRGLAEFGKSLGKVAFIAAIGYVALLAWWPTILGSSAHTVTRGVEILGDAIMLVVVLSVVLFLVLAALDYAFQVFQNEEQLKMTKQEVEEEQRQTEGDPQVKQERQRRQQEMAQSRMMEAVPESDVVITNPTHYAVALKYDRSEAPAPQVVAKGYGHTAVRIRERAEDAGIAIVRRPEVARFLHDSVEVGDTIPEDLFRVIAEILAWVYDPANQPTPEGAQAEPG